MAPHAGRHRGGRGCPAGKGALVAPPRFDLRTGSGALVFTAGALTDGSLAHGFRVYGVFPNAPSDDQLVAVYDGSDGRLRGIVIGGLLGEMRTGATGGVAVKYLSRPDASGVALIGGGSQARTQLEAIACVRDVRTVRVCSRTKSSRRAFATDMAKRLSLAIEPVDGAEAAMRDADIVVCATSSRQPVLEASWILPGAHVSTIGPKLRDAHELPLAVAEASAFIATDSPAQAEAYDPPFFLAGTPHMDRMVDLADVVSGRVSVPGAVGGRTLFCSVGLAGTEVAVADVLLRRAASR
ncbi:MAG: ornithine cyclodeaminase family protein [Dehalococcoidia bacterium]